jgi:hypothetical protein
VDVTLHRRQQDAARLVQTGLGLAGLDERLEVGHRALHRPRALDHLGQEHLPGGEAIAHDSHAVHQRPLDDAERIPERLARLLRVASMNSTIPCTSAWAMRSATGTSRQARSACRCVAAPLTRSASARRRSRRRPAREDDVLYPLPELRIEVVVAGELAGVDDRHIPPARVAW